MSKVISDELLRRAICVIELYIEEDMLADGFVDSHLYPPVPSPQGGTA